MKILAFCSVFLWMSVIPLMLSAQRLSSATFGDGLSIEAEDTSWMIKFGFRFQTLYIGELNTTSNDYQDRFLTRRSRLKFDGYVFNPDVSYKVELAISNRDHLSGQIVESGRTANIVLDAVLKWKFAGNWTVWFGQTKLPGNRERVVSSQKLQFVDRSRVNSRFNLDRDLGIQLHRTGRIGRTIVRQALALSMGEGRNIIVANPGRGHQVTGRIEILPFGNFTKKGDYFLADLVRESSPKLSIGITGDYNINAVRQRGNLGAFLQDSLGEYITHDITSFFADAIFKYKGFSALSEFAHRSISSTSSVPVGTGHGWVLQTGYVFTNNWEIAGRYTLINGDRLSSIRDVSEYTLGVSRYVVGHNLKVQSDLSYVDNEQVDDRVVYRFQLEVAF